MEKQKKITLSDELYKALEARAKAEGVTPDELGARIIMERATRGEPKGSKINKYGFLHVDKKLAEHLGVEFGKDRKNLPVDVEPIEGGFIVRLKA